MIFAFSDCLILLSICFAGLVILSQRVKFSSFLWPNSIPLCKCPIVVLSTDKTTDGPLGFFHVLVIVNNTAMNIGVLMFSQISVLGSFGYIPRSGIADSKSISIFNFLRYLRTAFHRGCTSLHSHQQCSFFFLLFMLLQLSHFFPFSSVCSLDSTYE